MAAAVAMSPMLIPIALIPLAAAQEEAAAPPFVAVPLEVAPCGAPADAARTPVVPICGSAEKDWIMEVNGNGLALGDFDGEDSIDLVIVDGSTVERAEAGEPGNPPRLFLNDGAGSFCEPGGDWAMTGGRFGTGAAAGDVDNDGDLDLAVLEWGPDRLFLNDDGAGFTEVTESAGLRGKRWATSGAFLDYDADGNLDLAVVNYLVFSTERVASRESGECTWKGYDVMCGPEGLSAVHDQLYRGGGDGTFVEATLEAGFRPEEAGYGLGITTLDFDRDGDTDLYVSNDSTPNHLWENLGDGTFREQGLWRRVDRDRDGKEQAGMGIGAGDWNGDGLPDLLVTNFSGEHNALYLTDRTKKGTVVFTERSFPMGSGGPSLAKLGWGTGFLDVDLDGDLDAFVLNGHVYPQADRPGTDTSYAQIDDLYSNEDGRFSVLPLHGDRATVGRAAGVADLDGDGRLDVVALRMGAPVEILRNATAGGHWLAVRAPGTVSNRDGIGAIVTVTADGVERTGEVRTTGGYQSSVPALVHVGLGGSERVERVEVVWTSGQRAVLEDVAVDRVVELVEPRPEGAEGDRDATETSETTEGE